MKPSQLTIALDCCIDLKQPVCTWGAVGIGKSQVHKQLAERRRAKNPEYGFIDFRAVLHDPTDLAGYLYIDKGKLNRALPALLPKAGEGLFFMDEINRAPALVQNACLQLVLDRKLGEYTLPDGWAMAAACNPTGGGTTKMSEALSNRFVHLDAETNLDDWCKWAISANIETVVIAFLRFRPDLLHQYTAGAKSFPTPRSWEFVSRITSAHPGNGIEHGLYIGAVGEGAATEYSSFLRLYRELPSIDAILLNPDKADVPNQPATMYAVAAALARAASDTNLGRVLTYLDRLPQEYAVMSVKDAIQRTPALSSAKEFTKWVIANQEVFA